MHAAIATAGWRPRLFSMSIVLIHSPPDLITSLLRSVICMSRRGRWWPRRRWGPADAIFVGQQGLPPSSLKYSRTTQGPSRTSHLAFCRPQATACALAHDLHVDAEDGAALLQPDLHLLFGGHREVLFFKVHSVPAGSSRSCPSMQTSTPTLRGTRRSSPAGSGAADHGRSRSRTAACWFSYGPAASARR